MGINNLDTHNDNNNKINSTPFPKDLLQSDTISWLFDGIKVDDFHGDDEKFLNFIKSSGFNEIYHISVNLNDISKYAHIKSVYNLLEHCRDHISSGTIDLVIFKKGEYNDNTEEEIVDGFINENLSTMDEIRKEIIDALENLDNPKQDKTRKEIIDTIENDADLSDILQDENVRMEFVNGLQNEDFRKQFAELYKTKLKTDPLYKQILDYSRITGSYQGRYKYLIGGYSRYQQVETGKRYIDALKNSGINMIEIK